MAEGVAGSFVPAGEASEDGRLELGAGPTAPYRTRVVVRRPADATAFSGTVVVEWLNVSSGLDANPDWAFLSPELVRTGVAWVGMSAQCIGVEGGAIAVDAGEGAGDAGVGLKGHDPERYGSLDHPGDAFAYDIYSPRPHRSPCRWRRRRRGSSKLSTSDVAVSRVRPSPRSSRCSVSRATPSGTPSKVNVCTMSSLGTHVVERAVETRLEVVARHRVAPGAAGAAVEVVDPGSSCCPARSTERRAQGRRGPGRPSRAGRRTRG